MGILKGWLERRRERQAKRVALQHAMEANGEAPWEPIGIGPRAVAVAVIGGVVAVIARLLGL